MQDYIKKIGIYDFFVLLCSGGIMMLVMWIINFYFKIVNQDVIDQLCTTDDGSILITILVLASIFIGMVFQELSNLLVNNVVLRDDALLHKVFTNSSWFYKRYAINDNSKEKILRLLDIQYGNESALDVRKAEKEIYFRCKYIYVNKYDTYVLDHNQALSGMSRSLCLFFISVPVSLIIFGKASFTPQYIITLIVCILLSVLFYERFERFAIIRYAEIIKKVLYTFFNSQDEK